MSIDKNIVNKKVIVRFTAEVVDQPIVYRLVKDFDLVPNIIKAQVDQDKRGYLVLGLSGYDSDYREALAYMRGIGLDVQHLVEHVSWDDQRCTQCGACTGICPSGALYLQRPGQSVHFEGEKCVMCGLCLDACPVQAMRSDF